MGSGPVAQAIHVPFVRSFPSDLSIQHFMDVDSALAEKLGEQHSANWTTNEDTLIGDPNVSVVVVGSPNNHHARQIIKSCKAGKKVVLAEKPLAVTHAELAEIQEAAKEYGTTIIVGTMHAFDEAYLEALAFWQSKNLVATSIDVKCFLPTNDEMVNYATELITPTPNKNAGTGAPPSIRDLITGGVLGLTMHDIPSVRDFAPGKFTLIRGEYVTPWGYLFEGHSGEIAIRFLAQLPGEWEPEWTMTVNAANATMLIRFQPSYVDAGSAIVEVTTSDEVRVFKEEKSPYTSEWQEIIDIVVKGKSPIYGLSRISEDLEFALSIIDQLPKEES